MLRLISLAGAARTPRRSPSLCGRTPVLSLGVSLFGLLIATTAVAQPAPPRQPPSVQPPASPPAVAPQLPADAAAPPGSAASPGAATPPPSPQGPVAPPSPAPPPGPGAAPPAAPGYPPPGYPGGYAPYGQGGYYAPYGQGGYAPYGQGGYVPYGGGAYPLPPPGPTYPPAAARPPALPPVPMRRNNPSMMVGGIALTAGGAIGFFTGTALLASASQRYEIYCDYGGYTSVCERLPDEPRQVAGVLVSVAGGIMLAVGIPLWIIGSKKVPVKSESEKPSAERQASLSIGPGSAALTVRF